MTREEAINEINEVFTPAYANYIVTALTEGATVSDKEHIKGHWIIDGHHRRCPKCDEYFCIKDAEGNEIPSSFCPNCGADMREVEE